MKVLAFAASLTLVLSAPAIAAKRTDGRAQAAQIAVLAKLAPVACPDIETDEETVAALMNRAKIRQRDLTARYRTATVAAIQALRQSVKRDREGACAQITRWLGSDGYGLLDEADPSVD